MIPTLGRRDTLRRVLGALHAQHAEPGTFEIIVVVDAAQATAEPEGSPVGDRARFPLRRLRGRQPGASSARNVGWRSARSPLVLFLDDDVLPSRQLVAEHLAWHARHPEPETGVLGRVQWAKELKLTSFMIWLDLGIQFDYGTIRGTDAGWGRFYTANASVKAEMLDRVGGFDEERLPYLYEDLDLALRMHRHGFRLLYNAKARAEHLSRMTPERWQQKLPLIARAERRFCEIHPENPPHFLPRFESAAAAPHTRGRAAAVARYVPPRLPWLGPLVWEAADLHFRQLGAPHFLAAWREQEPARAGARARSIDGPPGT